MITIPFLTDLDSRAAVKGSRDPLGHMSIWTHFGRHVVGNLTTVSTGVRDFTTLLLGIWLVEKVCEQDRAHSDVEVFIRWEQLAGYARAKQSKDVSFRGIEQVRANLSNSSKVTISAERAHQILGSQKIYGIWGLYTVPSRSSGLIVGDPPRLTSDARHFVESNYVASLSRDGFREASTLVRILSAPSYALHTDGKDAKLLQALAKLLRADKLTAVERAFYDRHLVQGGDEDDTNGRQRRLASLLQDTLDDDEFVLDPARVGNLAKRANDDGDGLRFRLDRIRRCEGLLAPTSRLFNFLLSRDDCTVTSIVEDLRASWGDKPRDLDLDDCSDLASELADSTGDAGVTDRWLQIARDLKGGAYADVVSALVAQNASVMKERGSAASWIEIKNDRLRVRFRDELAELPKRKELSMLWRFPYFLDSLRTMTAQVRAS